MQVSSLPDYADVSSQQEAIRTFTGAQPRLTLVETNLSLRSLSGPSDSTHTGPSVMRGASIDSALGHDFDVLAARWHRETRYWSSATRMAMHPAYQRIIALGEKVIPCILNDLRRTRGHWLWALYVLSGFEDPASEDASFDEAVDAWLNWGAARYGKI